MHLQNNVVYILFELMPLPCRDSNSGPPRPQSECNNWRSRPLGYEGWLKINCFLEINWILIFSPDFPPSGDGEKVRRKPSKKHHITTTCSICLNDFHHPKVDQNLKKVLSWCCLAVLDCITLHSIVLHFNISPNSNLAKVD